MKYTVINENDLDALIEKVNHHIAKDWKPIGGISSDSTFNFHITEAYHGVNETKGTRTTWYSQAMVKE
jgi:hypothetical protein